MPRNRRGARSRAGLEGELDRTNPSTPTRRDARLVSSLKARVRCFLSSLERLNPDDYPSILTNIQPWLEAHLRNHFTEIQPAGVWEQILGWRPLHTPESARAMGARLPRYNFPHASLFAVGQYDSGVVSTWDSESVVESSGNAPGEWGVPTSSTSTTHGGLVQHQSWPTQVEPRPEWLIGAEPLQGLVGIWADPGPSDAVSTTLLRRRAALQFAPPIPSAPTPPIPRSGSSRTILSPGPHELAEEASLLLKVLSQSLKEDAADDAKNQDLIKGALDNVIEIWRTLWGEGPACPIPEDRVQLPQNDRDPNLMVYAGCVVCYSAVAEAVLLPCNHLVLCLVRPLCGLGGIVLLFFCPCWRLTTSDISRNAVIV